MQRGKNVVVQRWFSGDGLHVPVNGDRRALVYTLSSLGMVELCLSAALRIRMLSDGHRTGDYKSGWRRVTCSTAFT